MTTYYDELHRAMNMLGQAFRATFIGQAVGAPGTGMTDSFKGVDPKQLIELPVIEDCQMGMAIGLAMAGELPVCVYPRWNFLLLAANQLINHLDKIPLYSGFKPRVIVRVAVPTAVPLNPGLQHLGNFSSPFRAMVQTVRIVELVTGNTIVDEYIRAARASYPTVLVEFSGMYHEKI